MTDPLEFREALSMLVWEIKHRPFPTKTMAFHHAERLLGERCADPIHDHPILESWPERSTPKPVSQNPVAS